MLAQSDNCAPGAGVSSSRISATLRQRLRRHLLRRISLAWVPLEQILDSFRTACAPMVLPLSSLRSVLQALADGLASQGTVDLLLRNGQVHIRQN